VTSPDSEVFLDVAGELLCRGRNVRFRAEGGSMYPAIRGGEAVLVEPVSASGLKNGEIALYRSDRGITAHRLVGRRGGSVFVFRGDAIGVDEFVEGSQVLGRVLSVERNGRSVRLSRRNPRALRALRRCAFLVKNSIARRRRLLKSTRPADGRRERLVMNSSGPGNAASVRKGAAKQEMKGSTGLSPARVAKLVLPLLILCSALMSPRAALAQSIGTPTAMTGTSSTTSGKTIAIASTPAVATGNTIIVTLSYESSAPGTITAADTQGNSYHQDACSADTGTSPYVNTCAFSAPVTTALVSGNSITVTFGNNVTAKSINAFYVSGLLSASPADQTASAFSTSTGTTATAGPTGTTAQPAELLVGAIAMGTPPTSATAGGSYTAIGAFQQNGGSSVGLLSEYEIVSATGAYSATGTWSPAQLWSATIVTYRAAGGTASKLAFGVQPSNTTEGSAINPAVTVLIEDSSGNIVNSTASVTLGLNPSSGSLSNGGPVAAVAGTATFSTLAVANSGLSYTLTATSGSLTSATSTAFNITGARYSVAAGNWGSTGTWSRASGGSSGAPVPSAADAVTVERGYTVTVDAAGEVCSSMQIGSGSSTSAGTLTFATSNSPALTVSGAVTLGSSTGLTTGTITFTSGSALTAGSLAVGGGGAGATGTITMTAGGTLSLGGGITIGSAGGTFTAGTGTVVLTAGFTLPSSVFTSFYNLTINHSSTTTLGVSTAISTGGTLTQTSGTIAVGSFTLTVNGTHTAAAGVVVSGAGGYTLASGATLQTANTSGVGGTITTTTKSLNTAANYTFNGTSAQTTSTTMPATVGNLTISNTAGVTLSQATTVGGNLAINSGTFATNNLALTLAGNFTNSGTFTAGTSNITFSGTGSQSIAAFTTGGTVATSTANTGTVTLMGNVSGVALTIDSGSGGKLDLGSGLSHTFSGVVTLTAGTLAGDGSTLTLSDAATVWTGTGSVFSAGTGTVVFSAGAQTINTATTFNNLTLSGTSVTKTLGAAIVVNGTLTINSGITLNTSSSNYAVTFGGNFTNSGTFTANASPITITGTGSQSIAGYTTTGLTTVSKTGGTATFTSGVSGAGLTVSGAGGTLDLGTGLSHTFSGTVTVSNGTLLGDTATISAAGVSITSPGAFTSTSGTLTITGGTGAFTLTSGTFTANGGTVTFTGASPIVTVTAATTFNTVNFSGSGTGSITGAGGLTAATLNVTVGAVAQSTTTPIAVTGTFSVTGGTFTGGTGTISAAALSIATGTFTSTTGVLTITGGTGAFTHTSGTFTANGGTVTFTGGSPVITVTTATTFATVNLSGSGTGSITGAGGFTAATLNLTAGTVGQAASTTIAVTGTFALTNTGTTFTGGSSTISAANLSIASGCTFTSTSNTLTLSGTSSAFSNAGTFTHSSGTVTFSSTSSTPTITVTAATTFYNVGFSSASAGSITGGGGLSLAGTMTVPSTLTLTIASGSSMTVLGGATLTNVGTVTPTGTLTVQNTGTYQHNENGGIIPAATWNSGSLCTVTGVTTTAPTAGLNQTFSNFTWNSTGQTAAVAVPTLTSVAGALTIASTNTGSLAFANAAGSSSGSLTMSAGSVSITGGTFSLASNVATSTSGTVTAQGTLNITGAFSMSNGAFNVSNDAVTTTTGGTGTGDNSTGTMSVGTTFTLSGGTFNVANNSSNEAHTDTSTGGVTVTGATSITGGVLNVGLSTATQSGNVATGAFTASSFSLSTGTLNLTNGSSTGVPSGTLNVSGAYSHTSGTVETTGSVTTGTHAVNFNGTSTQGYTGGGTVSGTVVFTVNSGATVALQNTVPLGTGSLAVSGTFDENCSYSLTTTGTLSTASGGLFTNCGTPAANGNYGNAVTTGAVTNAGTFSYVGTGTITLTGNFSNTGTAQLWGGAIQSNDHLASCPSAGLTLTATAARTWSGGGNYILENIAAHYQAGSPSATCYGCTGDSTDSGIWPTTGTSACGGAPTLVTFNSFSAAPFNGGVLLKWRSGREIANLGYRIYRDGERITASPVAGSALLAGAATVLTAGNTYTWFDPNGTASSAYSLEDVDIHGTRVMHGPFHVTASGVSAASIAAASRVASPAVSPTLGQLGRAGIDDSRWLRAEPRSAKPAARLPLQSNPAQEQFSLAGAPAVKIAVQQEGWYRITQAQLLAAGLSPAVNPRTLQLYANGIPQPLLVEGAANGRLGAQSAIGFYGLPADTIWSGTQEYWLVAGSGTGPGIAMGDSAPGSAGATSFPYALQWQPRTLYYAALLNGNSDANSFFGPVLDAADPLTQTLAVSNLASVPSGFSTLQVTMQGASSGLHTVGVTLNSFPVGNVTFGDFANYAATLQVPNTYLQDGANTLGLTVTGGDSDVSCVDTVLLTYPHSYAADNNALRLTVEGGQQVTVTGFTDSSVQVVDVTDPSLVSLVPSTLSQGSLTLVASGAGTRTLLAVGSSQYLAPAAIAANSPSSWHAVQKGADMVIVAHASLLSAASTLATLRQSEGHTVQVIDVQDLYDEFSYGLESPYAIRSFLTAAQANWQTKPAYVLLFGNGTFDPRNYLQSGVPDLVPVKLIDATYLETASDDWFADFNNNGVPLISIGRIPAESAGDATLEVSRLVAYDQSGGVWKSQALLVAGADDSPGDNFEAYTASVQGLLPGAVKYGEVLAATDPSASAHLLTQLNTGQSLVNFVGHGSSEIWADGLLSSEQAMTLTNGQSTPFVLSMTCLNGYFQDVYTTALAKALLKAPGGGAVAVWASSGLTSAPPASNINQAMVTELYTPGLAIGDAARLAKAATTDMDVRHTWNLFGDPAMKLQ
jgi:hypothetical protein